MPQLLGSPTQELLRWSYGGAFEAPSSHERSSADDSSENQVTEAVYSLQKFRAVQVEHWLAEVDRLALEFVKLPAVQLGLNGQQSENGLHSQLAKANDNTSVSLSPPRPLNPFAVCSAPNQSTREPVRFHSKGISQGSDVLHIGLHQLLSFASRNGEHAMLSTCIRDDGRPGFLLQFIKPLSDVSTAKQKWTLTNSVDITDAVRECAIEYACCPETAFTSSGTPKPRRNAVSEPQMSAEMVDWLGLVRDEATKNSSPSPAMTPTSVTSSSSTSLTSTSDLENSPELQLKPMSLATRTPSTQAIATFLDLIQEIRGHQKGYSLFGTSTTALFNKEGLMGIPQGEGVEREGGEKMI